MEKKKKKKKEALIKKATKQLSDLIPEATIYLYLQCYEGMKSIPMYISDMPFEEIKKVGSSLMRLQKINWLDPAEADAMLAFLCDKICNTDEYAEDQPEFISSGYSKYLLYSSLKRKAHMDSTSRGAPRDIAFDFLVYAIIFDLNYIDVGPHYELVVNFICDHGIRKHDNFTDDDLRKRYRALSLSEVVKNVTCCFGLSSDLRKRFASYSTSFESPFFQEYVNTVENIFEPSVLPPFLKEAGKRILKRSASHRK